MGFVPSSNGRRRSRCRRRRCRRSRRQPPRLPPLCEWFRRHRQHLIRPCPPSSRLVRHETRTWLRWRRLRRGCLRRLHCGVKCGIHFGGDVRLVYGRGPADLVLDIPGRDSNPSAVRLVAAAQCLQAASGDHHLGVGVGHAGFDPVFQSLQDVQCRHALRVQHQGPIRELPGPPFVAAGQRHAGQAGERYPIRRIQVHKLPVRSLGLSQRAVGQRLVGLQ